MFFGFLRSPAYAYTYSNKCVDDDLVVDSAFHRWHRSRLDLPVVVPGRVQQARSTDDLLRRGEPGQRE